MQSDGIYDFTYDAQGNRKSRVMIATGDGDNYVWDRRNRLTEVTHVEDGVTTKIKYAYDVNDHRVGRKVYDVINGTDQLVDEERYVYDGDTLVFVLDGAGELKNRLFTVGGETLGQERAGAGFEWILKDQLGSTRALVDDSGNVVASYDYDAYGNLWPAIENLRHRL